MRYTQIKVLKINGPWYGTRVSLLFQRDEEVDDEENEEEEKKECFNDLFNLLCIERQSSI